MFLSCLQAVLFLAALFKTMAMTAYILMLLEVSAAAAILPLLVAVVAVSVVFVALFWLSGFVALSGWYGSSKQASTSYAVGLMSSPIEELENVPAYVKLWLFEVRKVGAVGPNCCHRLAAPSVLSHP